MRVVDVVTKVLVLVGAINWGLVGLARFDLVAALLGMSFGEVSPLSSIVYSLVGISGIYQAAFFKSVQRRSAVLVEAR